MEKKAKIHYFTLTDEQTKTEKLEWFKETKFQDIDFQQIKPDKTHNWINLPDENNGFDDLIPLITKANKTEQIFGFSSLGVSTNRDEWVYDFSKANLTKKVQFFIESYNGFLSKITTFEKDVIFDKNNAEWDIVIKWSEYLKGLFNRKQKIVFNEKLLITANYRPFTKNFYYAERFLSDRLTQNHYDIFGNNLDKENIYIGHIGNDTQKPFSILVGNGVPSLNYLSPASGCRVFPLYRYEKGVRVENITDWALALFQRHYEKITSALEITSFEKDVISGTIEKLDIFHYVYAVLHQPEYRQKYEQNLKREFPRVPLYADFWKYAAAGEKLMDLHLHYESPQKITSLKRDVIFTPLQRKDIDLEVFKASKAGKKKKTGDTDKEVSKVASTFTVYPILKIRDGNIEIDELTTLLNVPAQALAYKLGNRSAIEWILDQYKPYKSDDKTIQEKFNTYNFADYKEQVIDLLQKVCWVSMETMKIVGEL